jgi:protocatechuate 3,4-dioxygenase beta subunit
MIDVLVLLLSIALQQVTQPPGSQPVNATCELRGRVTDKETGAPIARAIVTLLGRTQAISAHTDEEGQYEFTALEPDQYSMMVRPGEFRASHTMAHVPQNQPPGRLLRLSPGERRSGVDFALARAVAVSVRVVDEWGEPLARVFVSATPLKNRPEFRFERPRLTDDRGYVRLFGLAPGRYRVCAEAPGSALVASDGVRREQFIRTCYPSAAIEAEAQPVDIGGLDVGELEIRVRRGRTFTIAGAVFDASGSPAPGARVTLGHETRNMGSSRLIAVAPDGHFIVEDILPGDYTLTASLGGPEQLEERRNLETAYQPVHVEADDVSGVLLAMAKTVNIAGSVIVDDPAAKLPPIPGSGLMIVARLVGDPSPGMGSSRETIVAPDRTFGITGLFGRRVFDLLNAPRGWYLKSILYRGQDIIDVPTELKASDDPSGFEVVLSARGATVSGRVVDRDSVGGAVTAVMFPADPARWVQSEPSRATVTASGTFTFGPRRAGSYLVAALEYEDAFMDGADPDLFARLAKVAEHVTLAENEERTVDLRIIHLK